MKYLPGRRFPTSLDHNKPLPALKVTRRLSSATAQAPRDTVCCHPAAFVLDLRKTDSTTRKELYSRYVYSGAGVQGDFSTKLAHQQHILPKLIECGYTYSLDYRTQTCICMSKAGLVLEAGVSSLCSLCTCTLPPGGRLQGALGGRLVVFLTLFLSPERAQILLANFLNNKSVFQPVYSSYLI